MTATRTSALAGLRVLVVEDEYMVAEHIATLLEDFGCVVVGPVATIEHALVALDEGGLDGTMLDANLDGISSAPVAAALRAATMPFIVATGYGTLTLGSEALDDAPRVAKPFSAAELEAALTAAFLPDPNEPSKLSGRKSGVNV